MPLKKLQDQIAKYEDFQAEQAEKSARDQKRLDALQQTRQENFNLVVNDNRDGPARQMLDKTDEEIAELKKEINADKRRGRNRLRAMRTRILHTQEEVALNLQRDLQKRHETLTELRNSLIPEAEERLADLRGKVVQTEEEVGQLQKKARKISELNLDRIASEAR